MKRVIKDIINKEKLTKSTILRMSQIPLPNVKGDVRNMKMWRKDDFDRLVEKAKKLGIVVEPME